ncbi:hypothetical protein [Paenibacillus alba]|uniref:Uncharacterized protein n=1 Tax=Paenibacillus alba TaxID=1197127 RepID=A0ABU6GAP2_9BACL|nr:hypothetical protein [Paenibacillus alba]MEC0231259.1 hypothetical protein [Paenibacillus alba]
MNLKKIIAGAIASNSEEFSQRGTTETGFETLKEWIGKPQAPKKDTVSK